jgi:C4-dicarboxylate-specific signal transduction histidine kinase
MTTKKAGRGSGLGLSISRRIIADHGGTIAFLPDQAQGAVVQIVLPAAKESDQVESTLSRD